MVIKIVDQINDDELGERAWRLYDAAFRELNTMAVQRHLMYRHEFDEVMKYLAVSAESDQQARMLAAQRDEHTRALLGWFRRRLLIELTVLTVVIILMWFVMRK